MHGVYKLDKCNTEVAFLLNISSLVFGIKPYFSTLLLADIHVEVCLSAQPNSPHISEGCIQFPLRESEQKKGLALHALCIFLNFEARFI